MLLYNSTRFALTQIEIGYLPCTSFDQDRPTGLQTVCEKLSYKEAQQYVRQLEEAQKVAHLNLEKAQRSIVKQANKHRREPNFRVGDSVQVTIKNQKTKRPSCKLDYQMVGLYLILKKISNLYKVKLLDTIKVHLVFSLDKLQKASNDPLLGQRSNLPLLIQVNSNDEQEVEEILNSKIIQGVLKYKADQRGYNLNLNQYLAQNFVSSLHKLKEFYSRYLEQLGPPKYLNKQMECQHNKNDKQPIEHRT